LAASRNERSLWPIISSSSFATFSLGFDGVGSFFLVVIVVSALFVYSLHVNFIWLWFFVGFVEEVAVITVPPKVPYRQSTAWLFSEALSPC
jgi:hypothetical protein